MKFDPAPKLAKELSIPITKVKATLALLAEGNTIPFISRYRKEVTGSLDEVQVRDIKERSEQLVELEGRRVTVLSTIESQGKLTDDLKKKILECEDKTALEDLYLPYKPKRRTKATIAKERGLEPLAERIFAQPLDGSPEKEAESFVNVEKEVPDVAKALEGARHIVAEWISENADVRAYVRETFHDKGLLCSKVKKDFKEKETKFQQYYDFSELVSKIPSHRYLAMRRGEHEGVLSLLLDVEEDPIYNEMCTLLKQNIKSPFANQLTQAIVDSYKRLISPSVETDVRVDLKMQSDNEAVKIFAENLKNLLLSAPMGGKSVIGIDPGLRTGCKCAAVTDTGKYMDTMTLYLTRGAGGVEEGRRKFLEFVQKHNPYAIAIGNGTASRETEAFVKESFKAAGLDSIIVVQVSECGASVYSASDVAREEFPDIDLTIRGAISIARRLQDPLAELVKVEPKALGVGQYQHDVFQSLLERKLHEVVESCVNQVGVDLNTASASLLSYVAGIGPSVSKKIVARRDSKGAFRTRHELMEVSGLGERAFNQSAGFLRIRGCENPLDSSAVHPERYPVVESMAKDLNVSLEELVGSAQNVDKIDIQTYRNDDIGIETLSDIIDELKKPGRDPRKSFEMVKFSDDITRIDDLKKGMVIEGIITNVTAFGAFVDVGVHQDGLIHISELSNTFVKDPHTVVKTGDRIKVEVLDVNLSQKRISLSAKIGRATPPRSKQKKPAKKQQKFAHNPFEALL